MGGVKREILKSVALIGCSFAMASFLVSAERGLKQEQIRKDDFVLEAFEFLWQSDKFGYHHVWPFGWQIVLGSIIGFLGAAFGSVGGVGGGGIFVPMLSLVIGFDPKSATAISKCMIMGAAGSTVYYNLKLRHPTMDMPMIDYDLALLMQPMLMLGISIGVTFNVIFPDWMVTILLIVLFIFTSTKAFFKGLDAWNKETILKTEAARPLESNGVSHEVAYKPLPDNPNNPTEEGAEPEVPIFENMYWKELGLLLLVWFAFLGLQIAKNKTSTCSASYWVLNLMQIPISVGVSLYEASSQYSGRRKIASNSSEGGELKVPQLVLYCFLGIMAGIVGGLLGLGGGFILGPLFLELGIPPQVSSATSTFAMTFSSSMSVVEYYLVDRFLSPMLFTSFVCQLLRHSLGNT